MLRGLALWRSSAHRTRHQRRLLQQAIALWSNATLATAMSRWCRLLELARLRRAKVAAAARLRAFALLRAMFGRLVRNAAHAKAKASRTHQVQRSLLLEQAYVAVLRWRQFTSVRLVHARRVSTALAFRRHYCMRRALDQLGSGARARKAKRAAGIAAVMHAFGQQLRYYFGLWAYTARTDVVVRELLIIFLLYRPL